MSRDEINDEWRGVVEAVLAEANTSPCSVRQLFDKAASLGRLAHRLQDLSGSLFLVANSLADDARKRHQAPLTRPSPVLDLWPDSLE